MESTGTPPTDRPILLSIIGPPAVGKMTVGQELTKLTGWPLFYNHRILDLVTDFFPFGSAAFTRVVRAFNAEFFDAAGAHGLRVTITWGWQFDAPSGTEHVMRYVSPFIEAGGDVYFVELTAPLSIRLARNRTENRQSHKKTDWATDELLTHMDASEQWNSGGTLPVDFPHLVLDASERSAPETALAIYRHFNLGAL